MFDIDQIDAQKLNLSIEYYGVIDNVKRLLSDGQEVSNEVLSWVINHPPIYAAQESDELKKIMEEHAVRYADKKEKSIKFVQLLKNEFYDFLCTESDYYKKERTSIGGNINILITSVATAIATKLGGLEIGIVTSFITLFFIITGKMGKKAACKYYKAKEERKN